VLSCEYSKVQLKPAESDIVGVPEPPSAAASTIIISFALLVVNVQLTGGAVSPPPTQCPSNAVGGIVVEVVDVEVEVDVDVVEVEVEVLVEVDVVEVDVEVEVEVEVVERKVTGIVVVVV
jgi:hypothetical protein